MARSIQAHPPSHHELYVINGGWDGLIHLGAPPIPAAFGNLITGGMGGGSGWARPAHLSLVIYSEVGWAVRWARPDQAIPPGCSGLIKSGMGGGHGWMALGLGGSGQSTLLQRSNHRVLHVKCTMWDAQRVDWSSLV